MAKRVQQEMTVDCSGSVGCFLLIIFVVLAIAGCCLARDYWRAQQQQTQQVK